jgi:hypothetical protein
MLRYILSILLVSAAATVHAAAEVSPNAVDVHELDGAAYQLTLATKSHLPPAAAGLKPGATIEIENGKILFDAGDGGVARIAFTAEMVTDTIVRITTTLGGELPRAQQLEATATASYVSVTISVDGTISASGKDFTGTVTWDEKDDKAHNKIVYTASGVAPKN